MVQKRKKLSMKDIIIAIAGALGVLLILDLTPLGGNVYFYAKWVSCGSRPVSTKLGAGLGVSGVPNYVDSRNFGFIRSSTPYFCTEREAELAGFSANPTRYEFPHLNEVEFQAAIQASRSIND